MIILTGARDNRSIIINPLQIVAITETDEYTLVDTVRLSFTVKESATYIHSLLGGPSTANRYHHKHTTPFLPEVRVADIRSAIQSKPTSVPPRKPQFKRPS